MAWYPVAIALGVTGTRREANAALLAAAPALLEALHELAEATEAHHKALDDWWDTGDENYDGDEEPLDGSVAHDNLVDATRRVASARDAARAALASALPPQQESQ